MDMKFYIRKANEINAMYKVAFSDPTTQKEGTIFEIIFDDNQPQKQQLTIEQINTQKILNHQLLGIYGTNEEIEAIFPGYTNSFFKNKNN